VNHY